MSLRTLPALFAVLLVLLPGRSDAHSYGTGYTLAHGHGGGHAGTCLLMRPTGEASELVFCKDGDVFHLWDLDRDGRSVGTRWTTSNGHSGLCRWDGGAGKAGDCNYDFPETVTVTAYAGTCNQTATVDCRSWSQYRNVSAPGKIRAG